MAQATTTVTAIREQQETIVAALTPATKADILFRPALGEMDFEQWAEENPVAAFRRYQIVDATSYELPEISNTDVEATRTTLEWVVAYPKLWAFYGAQNWQDAESVIRADAFQINHAIGQNGGANFVAGQNDSRGEGWEIDQGEAVIFLRLPFNVYFYRSTT